ncbi:MAG: two-component regulator propeller domain-containing protein, partial [Chitinophagaceae bacterium]
MWFATSGTGFFSYDGYKITLYDHQPRNNNSVALNRIESIVADSAGNIWVGTFGKGLDKFDPVTGQFTHYRHDPKNSSSLINDSIMVIIQDRAGKMLWIGTRGGLDRFDPETGKFVHYKNEVTDPSSLSHNVIRAIYEDRQGTLWAGTGSSFNGDGTSTGEGGLNKLDQKTGKFTRYMYDPKDPRTLIDNRVRAIFEDSHGTFWIGTAGDGLHTMNRATGTFERHLYDPGKPEKLSRPPVKDLKGFEYVADHITFINEDATGSVWIGTLESGMNKYDPQTKKIKYFEDFNFGWWAFTSHEGVLWMSTFTSITFSTQDESEPIGPNLSSPIKASLAGNLYIVEPFRKKISYSSLNSAANSIYQESPGIFWVGTQDSGLIRDDRTQGIRQKFKFSGWNEQALSGNNSINVLRVNQEGNIWLGTNAGVELFNTKTQTFTRYQHNTGNKPSLENYRISSLYVDKEANLWIGTQTGLDYLNTKTNNITHYHDKSHSAETPGKYHIFSILEDRQQRLWLGTYYNGLYLLNRKTGKFKHYPFGTGITSGIYQDTEGTIWVGTKSGIYRYNPASDNFTPFNDPNSGATIDAVLNITEDLSKNLWIVTGSEVIRFNSKKNEVARFGKSQGVNPNSLSFGDNGSGGTGHDIFFGNQSGYYVFQPEQFTVNTRPPQILLTEFRIDDKLVAAGNNSPLRQPLWNTNDIRLTYNQNNFSFDFLAMHYSNPKDNRIIYMLENYDVGWRLPGVGQKAYYFNVPPGKYILKVKATNGNGLWSEKITKIHISPPWWRRWWVYAIFGLLFIGALWGFVYYRSQKLRSENRILEEKVAHRTAQLERSLADLQSTQAQLIQSEKMASLGELTAGIAHEIQNPLNFVNNFSDVNKELLAEMREEISRGNYDKVYELANDVSDNEEKINHH